MQGTAKAAKLRSSHVAAVRIVDNVPPHRLSLISGFQVAVSDERARGAVQIVQL